MSALGGVAKQGAGFALSLLMVFFAITYMSPSSQAQEEPDTELSFSIARVDTNSFPDIQVIVSVTNARGAPVSDLSNATFTVFEDGQEVRPVTAQQVSDDRTALTFVVAIDTSGSMVGEPP